MSTINKDEADLADAAVRACIQEICGKALYSPEAKKRLDEIYDAFCVTHSVVKLQIGTKTAVNVAGVGKAYEWTGFSFRET